MIFDKNTPVLLVLFNRPAFTQRVFDQIKKAAPRRLYVAADGPRTQQEAELCNQARAVAQQVDWDCQVQTLFGEKNAGCRIAVSEAVSWFFAHEEEGIILEDDCLPGR